MRVRTLALAAAALFTTSLAHAQTTRMGRCHMGECGWTREISRDFVGTSPRGYLVSETFVFCSKTLPAVMFTLDGEFSVHLLDLYKGGSIPGYQESSLALYMDVCHNVNVHRKYEDPKVYVERFRYEGERTRYAAVEEAVKQPADILKQ